MRTIKKGNFAGQDAKASTFYTLSEQRRELIRHILLQVSCLSEIKYASMGKTLVNHDATRHSTLKKLCAEQDTSSAVKYLSKSTSCCLPGLLSLRRCFKKKVDCEATGSPLVACQGQSCEHMKSRGDNKWERWKGLLDLECTRETLLSVLWLEWARTISPLHLRQSTRAISALALSKSVAMSVRKCRGRRRTDAMCARFFIACHADSCKHCLR